MSCLGQIYPFSLRVRRLASRHSKGGGVLGIRFGGCRSHGDHRAWRQPPLPERLRTCQGKPEVRAAVRNVFLTSWGPGKAEARGLLSCLGHLPHELVTGKGRSRRSTQPLGTSPAQAGDREGPVSAHPLPGPRRWSPGRAGPKAEGTYPVSCHPGGWSAAWVRGYRSSGARGGLNSECRGPSP